MTINVNLFGGVRIVQPPQSRKKGAKKNNPIANRDWKAIPFIRESVTDESVAEENALRAAWQRSSAETIIAMTEAGYSPDEIAKKFRFSPKDSTWQNALKDAQQYLKMRIAAERLDAIPDEILQSVEDSDGNVRQINISDKLRKAATAALFNGKDDDIKFSIVKGVPFHLAKDENGVPIVPTLRDVFQLSTDRLKTVKEYARKQYAEVFRTRDTTPGEKKFALPPALQSVDDILEAAPAKPADTDYQSA